MNIKKTCLNIEYDRYIESIGTLDVLFKVRVKGRRRYPVYCFGYSNNEDVLPLKNKTPFEVAIYECDSSIEYMSFFVEDEKLITGAVGKEITYSNSSILITDKRFNVDKIYIDIKMAFDYHIEDENVYAISKEAKKDLIGYRLDDDHYILFDDEDNFSGVVFKNLTDEQMEELKESNVI